MTQEPKVIDRILRHLLQPTRFYLWEKQAKAGALAVLRSASPGLPKADPSAADRAEIERLRHAVAELSVDNLTLKRGGPGGRVPSTTCRSFEASNLRIFEEIAAARRRSGLPTTALLNALLWTTVERNDAA